MLQHTQYSVERRGRQTGEEKSGEEEQSASKNKDKK